MNEHHSVDFLMTNQYKLNVISDSGTTTGSGWYEQGTTVPIGVDAGGDDLILNTLSEIGEDYRKNFDGTYKGYGDGKGKFGAHPSKTVDPAPSKAVGNIGGGNPNCDNEGITDGDADNKSGQVGEDYIIQNISAVGSSCNQDLTASLIINVLKPTAPPLFAPKVTQPFTFQPTETGTWTISIIAEGFFETRTITVIGPPGQVTGLDGNAVSTTEIDIFWTAPSDGGSVITGYKIERALQQGNPPFTTIVATTGSTDTTYSDSELVTNTTYKYRVSAINDEGTGPTSGPPHAQVTTN